MAFHHLAMATRDISSTHSCGCAMAAKLDIVAMWGLAVLEDTDELVPG